MGETILKLARSLCGAEEGDELLEALCGAAETAWRARLRDGVSAEACGEAFLCAAAMTAAADYWDGHSGGGVEAFTAGELSIRRGGGDGAAMRQAAERLMEPYAAERGFAFRGVSG